MDYERFRRDFLGARPAESTAVRAEGFEVDPNPDARFLQLTNPPAYERLRATVERVVDAQLAEEQRIALVTDRRVLGAAVGRLRADATAAQGRRERAQERQRRQDPLVQNWRGFAEEQRRDAR